LHLDFFEKAVENIKDAEDAFRNARYNACANRSYFAAYQAAVSLLSKFGVKSPKLDFDHAWVQANFVVNFIKRKKVLSSKFSDYLNDLRSLREIADYRPVSVSKKDAKRALDKANELIKEISKHVSHE
jgi:uncharacterized protein (UPF0332 family)